MVGNKNGHTGSKHFKLYRGVALRDRTMQRSKRALTWLSSLVCFCNFLVPFLVMASDPASQAHILLQIKQAITKDPRGALHSWTNESITHFCNWTGITCGSNQNLSIALRDHGLEGFISPAIGNLTTLYILDLSNNFLSGPVPSSLGALPKLKTLVLSQNHFDGSLPSSLFNASVLEFLDISNNLMTGVVPHIVGSTKRLVLLNLASNSLTGPLPDSLSNLVHLQGLDVSHNMLNGSIPSQLANLTSLSTIDLSNNQLRGHIPDSLGKMQWLRSLRLNNNLLSGTIPPSLGNCIILEDLVLSHNQLKGNIPTAVAALSTLLISFDMSYNSLIGPIPQDIRSLSKVTRIDLAHNKLSGNIPQAISECIGLVYLDLSNNHLKGPIPQEITSLKGLTWMLNLSYNSLEGSIPDLQNLTNINIVDVSHNKLNGTVPASLPSLHKHHLVFFNLSFNRLSGCFPQDGNGTLHINSSWIQGNPDLCVPFLPGFCSSGACAISNGTPRAWHAHLVQCIHYLLLTALLIWLGIGIYFCLAKLCNFSPYMTSQDQTSLVLSIMNGFTAYSTINLNSAINCLDPSSLIGSGASSDVYKVQFGNGQVCALKCFKPTARQQLFNTELEVLMNLRHGNLVPLRGFCNQGTARAILLDFMENGSLKKQLYDMPNCTLDLERRIGIAKDVAEGLAYLHGYGQVPIIHCDVKPGNILLDKNFKAHIADFGLATYTMGGLTNARNRAQLMLSSTLQRLPGTVGYIAPEYAAFKTIPSRAADVYSYGVVVLELLTRRQPGQGNFPLGIYSLPALVGLASRDGDVESVLDPELRLQMRTKLHYDKASLLASIGLACASEDPSARPSMEQVVFSLKYHHIFSEQNSEGSNKKQSTNGDVVVDADELVVNVAMETESKVADGVLAAKCLTTIKESIRWCSSWMKKKGS